MAAHQERVGARFFLEVAAEAQREREPAWIQRTLKSLRKIPPVTFAAIQISIIAWIVAAADPAGCRLAQPSQTASGRSAH